MQGKVGSMIQPGVAAITRHTEFADPATVNQLYYDEGLGFLALRGGTGSEQITIVGYCQAGDGNLASMSGLRFSRTELADVPPDERTIDLQGKGVGQRIYNTAQAVAGLAHETMWLEVCTATLDVARMHHMDDPANGPTTPAARIARHAGRMRRARHENLATITDEIHSSYGDAQSVYFTQPPRARLREWQHLVRPPVPSRFIIVRDDTLALYAIGRRWAL